MPDWLRATLAGVFGLGLISGVFWMAFRRMPDARSDGSALDQNYTDTSPPG